MYSAMGKKKLAKIGPDREVIVDHIAAFWTVMLCHRDYPDLVNMTSLMEDYDIPFAAGKTIKEVNL